MKTFILRTGTVTTLLLALGACKQLAVGKAPTTIGQARAAKAAAANTADNTAKPNPATPAAPAAPTAQPATQTKVLATADFSCSAKANEYHLYCTEIRGPQGDTEMRQALAVNNVTQYCQSPYENTGATPNKNCSTNDRGGGTCVFQAYGDVEVRRYFGSNPGGLDPAYECARDGGTFSK